MIFGGSDEESNKMYPRMHAQNAQRQECIWDVEKRFRSHDY